ARPGASPPPSAQEPHMPVLPVERHTPMPNTRFHSDPDDPDRDREELRLAALPDAAGAARRFVVAQLRKWGLDQLGGLVGSLAEDVELVADELVVNSVVETGRVTRPSSYVELHDHTPPVIVLGLRLTGRRLVCEVWDPSPRPPEPKVPDLLAESGRGLFLV